MRVTTWCVRVRVEPSAPYVTETKQGLSGARRSTERHSVASMSTSPGGKNSKETFIAAASDGRSTCEPAACRSSRGTRSATGPLCSRHGNGGQHVLAVGLDRAHALAGKACIPEEPAQPRERMLHHPLARALERVVALEEEETAAACERVAAGGEQPPECVIGCTQPIEEYGIEGAPEPGEVSRPEHLAAGGEQDAAVKTRSLTERPRSLGRAAGVREDGALRAQARCGLDQLRVIGADEQDRACRGHRLGGFDEAPERPTQARCGRHRRTRGIASQRLRPLAVTHKE